MSLLAKVTALVAHGILKPVLAEYRKLDVPPACDKPHAGDRAYDVASTTAAQTERAASWDHDVRHPERARGIGFGRQAP